MVCFYFNECIGEGYSIPIICSALEKSINDFNTKIKGIKSKGDNNAKKSVDEYEIIFEKDASQITLSGHSILDICKAFQDRSFRILLFSYLKNNPLAKYIPAHQEINEDEILQNQYVFDKQDATNLAIAFYCDWISFSLPLSPSLRTDKLELTSQFSRSLLLDNFYGDNIEAAKSAIDDRNYRKADGIDKLRALAENVVLLPQFLDDYSKLDPEFQDYILSRFEYAKREQIILSEKRVNNATVVDTLPKFNFVEELRIVNPVDIRVYFHETKKNSIIIASMNFKNRYGKNDQNQDIKGAEKIIKNHLDIKG